MKIDPKIERDGLIWFCVAGTVAICFSLFVLYVDESLTTSTYNEDVYKDLKELRSGQFGLESGVSDHRQFLGVKGVKSGGDIGEAH